MLLSVLLPLVALVPAMEKPQSGVAIRRFRIVVNLAESYTSEEFPSQSLSFIQSEIAQLVERINADTLVPYAGCRLHLPNAGYIRVWDSRFQDSYDAFSGQTGSFAAAMGHNHSLTSGLGSAWDLSLVLFRNGTLGAAGQAELGSVCNTFTKGRIACDDASTNNLQGTMTHEIGHAFGAAHTFDAITGACAGNRNGTSAVEIGSGITMMSFAGAGGTNDNYGARFPRFHARSTQDILSYLGTVSEALSPITNSGFTPPTVTVNNPTRTIPRDTPFELKVDDFTTDSFDVDFTWEQMNYATADPPTPPTADTRTTRTLFRCFDLDYYPTRMIPRREDLFAGTHPFEILPTVDRTLNFRCTIATKPPYDAQNPHLFFPSRGTADVTITVAGEPFRVTTPEAGEYVRKNCPYLVTWDVGGGDIAANVKISWTTNDGQEYTTLLESTENDGSEEVMIPDVATDTARIRVDAIDEIFFSINPGNFRTNPKPEGDFVIAPLEAPGTQDRWARVFLEEPVNDSIIYNVYSNDAAVTVPSQFVIGAGTLGAGFPITSTTVTSTKTVQIRLRRIGENQDAHTMDITVYPASPAKQMVSGTVDLGGYESPILIPATVTVVRGTNSRTVETYLGPNGEFRVLITPALSDGQAEVYVKPYHWLNKLTSNVTLASTGAAVGTVVCLNGDIDGDNEVGIGDYSMFSEAYGSTPADCDWYWAADLNGDLSIDVGDYALLSGNYGETGD